MSKILNFGILLLILFCLSGCSLFGPVKSPQENTYVINTLPPCYFHSYKSHLTLLVSQPQTPQAYNTNQIAYSLCPYALSYFSKNFWVDTPPQMLQPLIVQTLQDTCHYHAIVSPPFAGNYDLVLNTQLLNLYQDFKCKPSVVRLGIRVQLLDTSGHVIATRQFCINTIAPCDNPYGGVIAANQAVACFLAQLAKFVLIVS